MAGKKRSHSPEDEDDEDVNENMENGSEEMEVEEEEEDDRRSSRKKHKKKKKVGLMQQSGQTEADRRILRKKQRELHQEMVMGNGGTTSTAAAAAAAGGGGGKARDGNDKLFDQWREQNNELYSEVRYTREAVLDSENIDLIASKAAREAEKIVQVPRYDAVRLAQAFVKKGSVGKGLSTRFDWRGLGFQVGVCFNSIPSNVSFLYGPLDAEYTPKERKKPERRKKQTQEESEDEEQPEEVDQTGKKKSDGNELSAVAKHMSVISKTLKARHGEQQDAAIERSEEYETQLSQEIDDQGTLLKKKKRFIAENSQVNAVNCLFNPKSFTQTVENVFHFSFLVKESRAGIHARSAKEAAEYGCDPGPVIRPMSDQPNLPPPKQAIVSLNMKDWRDMCKAYNVEESDVPHRHEGKVAKFEKKARKSK